ncbi:MAG TPA: transcription antitermination factor NusB [Geminicoccaceae bacterium]|nr:transcription antitermination factor NusB [Geminicoccaceae bacterium]
MTRRRAARFGAVQALYQIEMSGAAADSVISEFERHRLGDLLEPLELPERPPRVDRAWFADVTRGAWQMAPELDPRIEATLATGWSLGRAGYLLRAFLRAGAFELAARRHVPAGVVVNEYVALAHAFLSSEDAGFVNAVLDRLAGELRPDPEAAPPASA